MNADEIVMGGRIQITPFWRSVFTTFNDAALWQINKIADVVGDGFAIRSAGIDIERDYESGEVTFIAFVRAFPQRPEVESNVIEAIAS